MIPAKIPSPLQMSICPFTNILFKVNVEIILHRSDPFTNRLLQISAAALCCFRPLSATAHSDQFQTYNFAKK